MLHIRQLTRDDLPFCLGLTEQAGWNQLPADWLRFLELEPAGCFLAEWRGQPAGTTTTCIFGPVAWIAMVLVEEGQRGQGIGRALMRHALDFLDGQAVRTIRLDATSLGQPLYESLGFVGEYRLARYAGRLASVPSAAVAPCEPGQLEEIVTLDRAVTGTDRRKLLARLCAEYGAARAIHGEAGLDGYLLTRPGRLAVQVGPGIATPSAGPALLADAAQRLAGRDVFIDIPCDHAEAIRHAEALGLTVRREFLRMRRGEPLTEQHQHLWASSGPELG
jgi:GNAT superfamily N-acetyltransferase